MPLQHEQHPQHGIANIIIRDHPLFRLHRPEPWPWTRLSEVGHVPDLVPFDDRLRPARDLDLAASETAPLRVGGDEGAGHLRYPSARDSAWRHVGKYVGPSHRYSE